MSHPSRAANHAPIFIAKVFNFHQVDHGLMLNDTELTNPFVLVNEGVSDGVSREVPFVIIALIGFINDPDAVCKQDAKILEGAASGRNQRFIT